MTARHQQLAAMIWQVADLLRGDYKQSEYARVILPFTVLRRLDCVLGSESAMGTAGAAFSNTSRLDLRALTAGREPVARNLRAYLGGFSPNAREIFDCFDFDAQITRLDNSGLLHQVVGKFAAVDLRPEVVDNHQMGYAFEELIRRFSEISNETAGEHFTPREVVKLMVSLLLAPDRPDLIDPGVVRTVYDPACGTGGMLTAAEGLILAGNPDATVQLFGQELNPESYAICRSDMMIKGEAAENIRFGNSLSDDKHGGTGFDYLLANPPFGVEWKKVRADVEREAARGHAGRFGAGLPRINDGSLLFLQHMISHMKRPDEGGSRIAIVFNGSPLFAGAAGSGESEIRRWILENDWLESVVALPDQLFYNTGISTYVWILTNRKHAGRRGKVVLLDARDHWVKMGKSLGNKRRHITDDQIEEIADLYDQALAAAARQALPADLPAKVKVFATTDFGYRRITVERPLRLRFEVTEEVLTELTAVRAVARFGDLDTLVTALRALIGPGPSTTRSEFAARLAGALRRAGLGPLPKPVDKAVWSAVSVTDPGGELQADRAGHPLPDPDLRDHENVPLCADIDSHMRRDVLPHVPDAWIDDTKTRIGYEIPFTRHFHVCRAARPLAEIDAELRRLDADIQRLLSRMTG